MVPNTNPNARDTMNNNRQELAHFSLEIEHRREKVGWG